MLYLETTFFENIKLMNNNDSTQNKSKNVIKPVH